MFGNNIFKNHRFNYWLSILPIFFASTEAQYLRAEPGVIVEEGDPIRWSLSSDKATYQIIFAEDGDLAAGFFGPVSGSRLAENPDISASGKIGTAMREIPYRGGFMEMNPALEVIFGDNTRELELRYVSHETGMLEQYPYIVLHMKDSYYPLQVSEYIRVIPELDIFEKWLVLRNKGEQKIIIENASSGSALLPEGTYDLIQLSGDWGREFYPRRSRLTPGLKSLFIRDLKSHRHAPLFMVRPSADADEHSGPVWFGTPLWTGNWRIDLEVLRNERLQVSGGINFWDTHWVLEGGEEFVTPKMVFGFSDDGPGGASRRLHRYQIDHLAPESSRGSIMPVLYNSWYATTFDINEPQQIKLARLAAEVGVELFVVDDAWFKGRNNSLAGLGDWTPDPVKFPRGLGPLISTVKGLEMKFGIWVEPEMVNPNSDLFRDHPEWALHTPNRTAHEHRNQLMLNLARDDVRDHILGWMDRLLSENEIDFIKWDMNRRVSEAGWPEAPAARQRELWIRYVHNLTRILKELKKRHPQVVFESCSGGGGRANLAILSLMDQVWTSDNTDPGDRLHIQYGYSHFLPARTMVNWVTDHEWHDKDTSLKFRFHVSMAGNLGVGCEIDKWSNEDKMLAREMVGLYKSVRHIIQLGDQYRLRDPFKGNLIALQFVSRDGSESVVFCFQTLETLPGSGKELSGRLVLHGLDPQANYTLSGDIESVDLSGAVLMSSGIYLPLENNYTSKMVILKRN